MTELMVFSRAGENNPLLALFGVTLEADGVRALAFKPFVHLEPSTVLVECERVKHEIGPPQYEPKPDGVRIQLNAMFSPSAYQMVEGELKLVGDAFNENYGWGVFWEEVFLSRVAG